MQFLLVICSSFCKRPVDGAAMTGLRGRPRLPWARGVTGVVAANDGAAMIDVIWVKAVVKALVLPPTGPLLLAAFGLLLAGRHPRAGRLLASGGVALLLLISIPAVADALLRLVSDVPPLDFERAKSAQALIVLGGGTRRNAVEYGGDTLGRLTLERVRYGARVARLTGFRSWSSAARSMGARPKPA